MKLFFLRWTLCIACMIGISTAIAQNDPMRMYYSNTLVCRSVALQCHIWFQSNGTYRQYVVTTEQDGSFHLSGVEGRFTVSPKNGSYETCLMPRNMGGPMGGRAIECYVLAGHATGDAWTVTQNGMQMNLSLQAGRQVNSTGGFIN